MFNSSFGKIFTFLQSRRQGVLIVMVVVLMGVAAGLFFIPFDHSMEIMLPKGSTTKKTISLLRDIDFSTKIVISFSKKDDSLSRHDFFVAVDQFADSLDSKLITKVISSFDNKQMMHDLGFFLKHVPELFSEKDLKRLDDRLTPEGVQSCLHKKYIQLLKPEGSFMGDMVRRDPLDLQMTMIKKIRALSASFGYAVNIEDGHIVSTDGNHLLLMLETTVPFTDSTKSRELIGFIKNRMKSLPKSISADIICGHLHTLSNEKVIKHDILLTISLAGIAFALLFVFFFKDARAIYVFILPFAALLVSVNLSALIFGKLSPMMLGLGSVIAGITVDYAIHVYIAVRRVNNAFDAVRAVAQPILLGALTTASVFVAFFVSLIPGYHQLACFSLLGVVISVTGALFILPLFLLPNSLNGVGSLRYWSKKQSWFAIFVFLLFVGAAVPLVFNVQFDRDIQCLDGSDRNILDAEARFKHIWGDGEVGQAIAVVSNADYERAMILNDQLFDLLIDHMKEKQIASLSRVWKSKAYREKNLKRWNHFWSRGRVRSLKKLFDDQGHRFGFAADAFAPFFHSLQIHTEQDEIVAKTLRDAPSGNIVFNQLVGRFVQAKNGVIRILTFFPDRSEYIKEMEPILKSLPDTVLISRNALSGSLARDYTREFVRIGSVALGLVLLVCVVLLRDLRKTLIVLLPAFAGVLGVVVLADLVGTALNVMNLISGIIVIGICIDYGVFYLHSYINNLELGTKSAISLSAGTTLLGSGALLFAHHPALYSVGITLVGGITAGYATSMLIVPAACSLWLEREK